MTSHRNDNDRTPDGSPSDDQLANRALDATESAEVKPSETETLKDDNPVGGARKRIGQSSIKRPIASGGMSTVYEALQ
jgi:hypothetical protein